MQEDELGERDEDIEAGWAADLEVKGCVHFADDTVDEGFAVLDRAAETEEELPNVLHREIDQGITAVEEGAGGIVVGDDRDRSDARGE